jgi:GTP cyclohydrolase II
MMRPAQRLRSCDKAIPAEIAKAKSGQFSGGPGAACLPSGQTGRSVFTYLRRLPPDNYADHTIAIPALSARPSKRKQEIEGYNLIGDYNLVVSSLKVKQVASADFPTRWGHFLIHGFATRAFASGNGAKTEEAVALVMGEVHSGSPLVRIHSQCLTGDVFGSLRCDCRQQLEMALSMIAELGAGVLIYEQQEGRGIGLMAKLQAYALQDSGLDTVEANERLGFRADHREFLMPVEILKALDIRRVRLLSNNPDKVAALEHAGIQVTERVPCEVAATEHTVEYLKTKREKLGHLFTDRKRQH